MNDLADQIATFIPVKYQTLIIAFTVFGKLFSEFYSSIRAGGGLRRIIMSFWFGEQVPKVVAQYYKQELSTTLIPSSVVKPTKENDS